MKLLITGSSGLIGSEAVKYFDSRGHTVIGVDNNMRKTFFGPEGDTAWRAKELSTSCRRYQHHDLDIRDRSSILELFTEGRFDAVIHTAAQPSHDRARDIPFLDFEVNALGTLNLLEANRRASPEAPFVHMSTNKVYGDSPNHLRLVEKEYRWDYADREFQHGIPENFDIDQSMHSLFGASKLAADILVQEYGRYFGMPSCTLRAGCLTGASHAGVELHGFLSYLIKCNMIGKPYNVFGYKGKQVRDNIHSADVVKFMDAFIEDPRVGEVYNLGGGKANSISILEAFNMAKELTGKAMRSHYTEEHRLGDHMCYYSDLSKIKDHFPEWGIEMSLEDIFQEIVDGWSTRLDA